MLGEYQKRIEAAPKRQSELIELTRDYETFQASYKSLLGKKEDSNVSANLERRQIGEQFKILDAARMPERPSSPNRPMLLAIGLLAGLGVGIALAALIEYLDKRLKSEADVKAALNLMVLATIPVLDDRAKVRVWRVAAISITAFLAATFGAVVLAWGLWK
jgi:capsular polysaccharide biosynthesis protein